MYAWPVLTLESLDVGVDVGWNWQTSVHSECVVVHELGLSGRCWKRSDARDHVMGMLAPFVCQLRNLNHPGSFQKEVVYAHNLSHTRLGSGYSSPC